MASYARWELRRFEPARGKADSLILHGFLVGQLVLNVLLKSVRIGPDQSSPVHKHSRRAVDLKLLAVRPAGVNRRPSLRAGHARLEPVRIEPSLRREVRHLRPGIGRRYEFLLVINGVIDLPERRGILLVSATSGQGRSPRPG